MNKLFTTALLSTMLVGATTAFASPASPFEDVPKDHWAYDAIAQLSNDGVLEGYGDGTYEGSSSMTRYEFAQATAKAMTKTDEKHFIIIDKLCAEFSSELQALGVRVANLEKKADNVKITGSLRYRTFHKMKTGTSTTNHGDRHQNELRLTTDITANVNKHWDVKSRIYYNTNLKTSGNVHGDNITMDRLYADGTIGKIGVQLGKLPFKSNADFGLTADYRVSGAKVSFGGHEVNVDILGGRMNLGDDKIWDINDKNAVSDVASLQIYNKNDKRISWGVGYTHATVPNSMQRYTTNKNSMDIVSAGLGVKFNRNVGLNLAYAQNLKGKNVYSQSRTRYSIELDYKGANKAKKGSYGAYVAYRHIGEYGGLYSTYRANNSSFFDNFKGIDVGATYVVDKNIVLTAKYLNGDTITTGNGSGVKNSKKYEAIFGQVEFFF